jgi:hypothetical protein
MNKKVLDRMLLPVITCARCGSDHTAVLFRRLQRHGEEFNFWANCPTTGEPIMMQVTGSKHKQEGNHASGI